MGLMDRMRRGTVGAVLRYGIEEGTNQVTKTRARQGPAGVEATRTTTADVGLPSGETPIEELRKESDSEQVMGVSIYELRALCGIPNPFDPPKLVVKGMDFSDLEGFRAVRDTSGDWRKDAARRKALVEKVEADGVAPIDERARRYGSNFFDDE